MSKRARRASTLGIIFCIAGGAFNIEQAVRAAHKANAYEVATRQITPYEGPGMWSFERAACTAHPTEWGCSPWKRVHVRPSRVPS